MGPTGVPGRVHGEGFLPHACRLASGGLASALRDTFAAYSSAAKNESKHSEAGRNEAAGNETEEGEAMMQPWSERPTEVANLLNPAFLGALLRKAVDGYAEKSE